MVYLIYCLHGDEIITEEIAKDLECENNISVLLGNPLARKRKVRYIDTDLNRSFQKELGYEASRAIEIKKFFQNKEYDLIIDLHSTKARMPPVAIITNSVQLEYVGKLGLKKAVFMNKDFSSGGSLIENVDRAISLEVNFENLDKQAIKRLISTYDNDKIKVRQLEVYEVVEIVKEDKEKEVKNFKKLSDGSFPVFYGEPAYKDVKYLRTVRKIINL